MHNQGKYRNIRPIVVFALSLSLFCIGQGIALGTDFPNVIYRTCYDGDTCRFDIPNVHPFFGENIPVRPAGIDTPEKRGKCQHEKDLAIEARDYVRGMLEQAQSIILKDVERGKYFRIVASVEADGQDVSDLLIQEGLAVVYDGGTKGKEWCE